MLSIIDFSVAAKTGIKFQPKGRPKPKPKPNSAKSQFVEAAANDFLSESTTTVNLPPCSETLTVDVSVGPTEPELMNITNASSNLGSIAEVDPLTGVEGAIINDNDGFRIENLSSGSKEAENSLFGEPFDIDKNRPNVAEFFPRPKAQTRKVKQIANNYDQDVGHVQHEQSIHSVPSQTDFMENEHAPLFTDSVPKETISDFHMVDKSISLTEISQMDSVNEARRSSERLTGHASKALHIDIDFVPENESLVDRNKSKWKSKSKSKKPVDENKKPVRKCKKATEVQNELTEVPKKKFSHSTKRNDRRVNPELLKIPEDELELHMHTFPLKDLIRLREHKNRWSEYAENATYYNYRTHMKTTAIMKWTKQDTELFYEAIQELGMDLSIIKELFPGRTLKQIKSKYIKEDKQNRLRIESALNTRAKDHSHYNFVIEQQQLKQAQARAENEDSENDDPFANVNVQAY
ncbi:uncharacterized protein LOC143609916 [Bidens hawaiensis]|uniref:uncharacterized protein LOC143609916 n=1 Tax=Bidens hawaiensis TaxID=980011 RepID=UPI0040490E5A